MLSDKFSAQFKKGSNYGKNRKQTPAAGLSSSNRPETGWTHHGFHSRVVFFRQGATATTKSFFRRNVAGNKVRTGCGLASKT
jgi:hypothetical protein